MATRACRLEELLVDCAAKIEGDLCVPVVQECLRKVVDCVPHPTHATNVLKLLSGDDRDALEVTCASFTSNKYSVRQTGDVFPCIHDGLE